MNRSLSRRKSGSLKALPLHVKEQTLGWEMMGAGKDPLKKNHDYARLTDQPLELMRTTFVFKKTENTIQNVPIIDNFSRTLACPIATQRQNPLVAARIGSNLTLATQNMDITSEGIRILIFKSESLETRVKIHESDKYMMSED